MELKDRLSNIRSKINAACERSGRNSGDITIIAVTKYTTLEIAEEALAAGLHHLGESRWQDAKPKWEKLGDRAAWHFIGSLQTNKVKDVIGKFSFIHSLDRIALAEELNRKAAGQEEAVHCFIQVNVSGEQSKHGLSPDGLFTFAEQLKDMPHIQVEGLMTMAPYDSDREAARPVFRRLRELRGELNDRHILPYPVCGLSMGMSGDFETAVEEGATYIRLGTILVGKN